MINKITLDLRSMAAMKTNGEILKMTIVGLKTMAAGKDNFLGRRQ